MGSASTTRVRTARARQNFEQFLCALPELSWLASCGAQYTYLCTILAATPHQAQACARKIAARASSALRRRRVFVRTERYRLWAATKRAGPARKRVRYILGNSPGTETLGESERALLSAAQEMPFWSYRELARHAGLSIGSALRAVQRLKARKIF